MISNIKKKIKDGIVSGELGVVNLEWGNVIERGEVFSKKPLKFKIDYMFVKFNVGADDRLLELLGRYDYLYFSRLSSGVNMHGVVEFMDLEKLISVQSIKKLRSKLVKFGLVKKLCINEQKKAWYINPFICHKNKYVWGKLIDEFVLTEWSKFGNMKKQYE